jgi:hypothetical protein
MIDLALGILFLLWQSVRLYRQGYRLHYAPDLGYPIIARRLSFREVKSLPCDIYMGLTKDQRNLLADVWYS